MHDRTVRRVAIVSIVAYVTAAFAIACTAQAADRDPPPIRTAHGVKQAILDAWPSWAEDDAVRVAVCESRLDQRAVNRSSGAAGVFQFLRSTWNSPRGGPLGGAWNLWRRRDPLDARWNIRAAKRLWVLSGRTFRVHWSCA